MRVSRIFYFIGSRIISIKIVIFFVYSLISARGTAKIAVFVLKYS